MGVSADSFETYSAHDLRFFWLKSWRACACDILKADRLSPLNSRLCRTLLSRARLAFRASWHSSSNQRFDFLGMVVALGTLSFVALVMCLTKDCKWSPSSEKVPAPNQSWRGCNHPTSNWPYQGHQIPYLIPRTTDWLSPLWANTDHWPYAAGVCTVTGMSWWILHSRLVECSLRDNSRDLHSGIPARSGILLSDIMKSVNFN